MCSGKPGKLRNDHFGRPGGLRRAQNDHFDAAWITRQLDDAYGWMPSQLLLLVYRVVQGGVPRWWYWARVPSLVYTLPTLPWYYPALHQPGYGRCCTHYQARRVHSPGCLGGCSGPGTAWEPGLPGGIIYLGEERARVVPGLPRGGFIHSAGPGKPEGSQEAQNCP